MKERLLRSTGQFFVGRTEEKNSILKTMKREAGHFRRAVLIFGPPGIGKSYLATWVAYSLTGTHERQKWFNCSKSSDLSLQLDDQPKIQNEGRDKRIGNKQKALNDVPKSSVVYIAGSVGTLLIFDDV